MVHERLRILIVEDSLPEVELIRQMLRHARGVVFDVEQVGRLEAGIACARRGGIDAALLDLGLPDGRGPENLHRFRDALPELPIVILTNDEDDEAAAAAVRAGAQDYLIKRDIGSTLLCRALRYAVERRRAETALRESEERYALAVAGAMDGIWDWNVGAGEVYYSPRCLQILGLPPGAGAATTAHWFDRVHPLDRPALEEAVAAHLRGDTEHFEHEHRLVTGDTPLWVLSRGLAVRDAAGRPYRLAGSLTDISARKRAEEKLVHDALHDALTQLPNRTLFLDRLALALRQYRRDRSRRFAVLFFDLDRFKMVNDSLGHSVGDELLVGVARELAAVVRPGDSVARLGGDEFAILVGDITTPAEATLVAERVHMLLGRCFHIAGHDVYTSASVGIAIAGPDYERPEEILRDADIAMYRAKRVDHASYAIFDSDMHQSAVASLKLETELRRAVDNGDFAVHYQPIVSLETMTVLGFEALLRWCHPQLGLLGPDSFIRVAEETGLIVPLTWWVLREASAQTRRWQDRFPAQPALTISVNVSGKIFARPDLARRVLSILEETGLDPHSLQLEITETVLMDHGDAAVAGLRELRDRGVQLHLDDFGTGYSSLSYLQMFSYDTLKIDRSFVSQLASGGSNTIVQAIVGLGRMLNMNVIAEGVETAAQADRLRQMACPEAQGYWFSRPLDAPTAQQLLAGPALAFG